MLVISTPENNAPSSFSSFPMIQVTAPTNKQENTA